MKPKFIDYLTNINVSDVAKSRIELIYNEILSLYNNIEIDDILLTNVNNNGNAEFQSLWLFNKNFAIECKNFLYQDDFDIVTLNNIIYYNIKKSNYKFNDMPNVNSVVFLTIIINNGKNSCNLTASGNNCPFAKAISQKYFLKKMDNSLYKE